MRTDNISQDIEQKATRIYDQGLHSLSWQTTEEESSYGTLTLADFEKLLSAPNAKKRIQAIAPQRLYQSLKVCGVESCLDVLKQISQDQFSRILDYDAWSQDVFVIEKAMAWVALCGQIDETGKNFFDRFKYLDEEYQLSMMIGQVQIASLEIYEDMPSYKQDEYTPLPCQELYYKIISKEEPVREFIHSLVNIGLTHDLRYTYSLLSHANYMPPNESQADLMRIRIARLEEDGFVSYDESLGAFHPIDKVALAEKYADKHETKDQGSSTANALATVLSSDPSETFLQKNLGMLAEESSEGALDVKSGLLFLANNACAAVQIEPDQINEMRDLLNQVRAFVSLGLEFLANSDIKKAQVILVQEHPKVLFRVGLSLISDVMDKMIESIEQSKLIHSEIFHKPFAIKQWGVLQVLLDKHWSDVVGQEHLGLLKGLLNRFPMQLALNKEAQTLQYKAVDSRLVLRGLQEQSACFAGVLQIASRLNNEIKSMTWTSLL